ncbi:MAG: hypothetical protein AVDCRST_MAG73-991, partial [uncultured Thermomicrobiales bacterium]
GTGTTRCPRCLRLDRPDPLRPAPNRPAVSGPQPRSGRATPPRRRDLFVHWRRLQRARLGRAVVQVGRWRRRRRVHAGLGVAAARALPRAVRQPGRPPPRPPAPDRQPTGAGGDGRLVRRLGGGAEPVAALRADPGDGHPAHAGAARLRTRADGGHAAGALRHRQRAARDGAHGRRPVRPAAGRAAADAGRSGPAVRPQRAVLPRDRHRGRPCFRAANGARARVRRQHGARPWVPDAARPHRRAVLRGADDRGVRPVHGHDGRLRRPVARPRPGRRGRRVVLYRDRRRVAGRRARRGRRSVPGAAGVRPDRRHDGDLRPQHDRVRARRRVRAGLPRPRPRRGVGRPGRDLGLNRVPAPAPGGGLRPILFVVPDGHGDRRRTRRDRGAAADRSLWDRPRPGDAGGAGDRGRGPVWAPGRPRRSGVLDADAGAGAGTGGRRLRDVRPESGTRAGADAEPVDTVAVADAAPQPLGV